ncbi:MAG: hypothetical protein PHR06_16115 [Candidatus Cloacimonetes bacterium]|nr:hypothetical protein [Candidatus Cloacimonadota bacterium]
MTGLKSIFCLAAGIMLILAITAPVSADIAIPTSTEVFFEKNGEPYNESIKFTVKCYGYSFFPGTPEFKEFLNKGSERKEKGTYDQKEVFSYFATADYYGAKIYEPFYLNYRIIDYCTLYGETNGRKFIIADAGESPIPNCSMRENRVIRESDACYMVNDEAYNCFKKEGELQDEKSESCRIYPKAYDPNKTYQKDVRIIESGNQKLVVTDEYKSCTNEASATDLNCSRYYTNVSCEDYCTPSGSLIERDCSLYFTIPTDENGNIIEMTENKNDSISVFTVDQGLEKSESLFTAILKFLGLY